MEWKTQTYRFQSSRRFRRASGGALAKKREREKGRKGSRHDTGRGVRGGDRMWQGAQVAQHGGEMGEANDWCRLHGLALQLSGTS